MKASASKKRKKKINLNGKEIMEDKNAATDKERHCKLPKSLKTDQLLI